MIMAALSKNKSVKSFQSLTSLFRRVSSDAFYLAFREAHDKSLQIQRNADLKESYEDHECWLSLDGRAGASVCTKTSELCSVFSTNKSGSELMHQIVSNYDYLWLSCFTGFLLNYYKSFGFDVIRVEENWHGENQPDVAIMEYARFKPE